MPANSDFVRHTALLGLKRNDKGGGLERAPQDKLSLFAQERARHPAGKKFFLEVCLYIRHVSVSGRIIRQDNAMCQSRHVSQRKAMPQIGRKESVIRCKVMFKQKGFEGVGIVRVWDALKNRRMVGSR